MIPSEWLSQAALRITPHIRRTPLTKDSELNIFLKWENQQVTGSFKARGALNKVLSLEPWEQQLGLVTASMGNHGQGVALAGKIVNSPVVVFAPKKSVLAKIESIRGLGAEVRYQDGSYDLIETSAIQYASENQKMWISPYNDGLVIAGQGTIGLEISQDLPPDVDTTWIVPVGGGGLLAGIGAAIEYFYAPYPKIKHKRPKLIGVQAAFSAFMHSLYYLGTQEGVSDFDTLADGLAGAVEENSLTIPMVKRYADDIILVSEEAIAETIAFTWQRYGERVEGSGAVGLAAILMGKIKSPAIVVISGGNIQPEVHNEICSRNLELK